MDNFFDDIMKCFLAQINSSLKISELISKHGNEKELSEDSIVIGLIYRLMNPMDNEDMEESIEKAKNIYESLYQDKSEDDEEDYEENDEINNIEDLKLRKVKCNTCNCELCINARVCLLNYKDHEPKDNLEMMFKNAIDNACEKGKLYI